MECSTGAMVLLDNLDIPKFAGGVTLSFCDMGAAQDRKHEKPIVAPISASPEDETTGLTFGEFFKKKRMESGINLRAFCLEHGFIPNYISKLERGRVSAPCDEETLHEYAGYLRLNSSEWEAFSDLAFISAGRIPVDLTDKEVAVRLPVLFRVARNKEVDVEKLKELVELIRKS